MFGPSSKHSERFEMKLDTIYRAYKILKAISELAYLLGYRIGKKTRKR